MDTEINKSINEVIQPSYIKEVPKDAAVQKKSSEEAPSTEINTGKPSPNTRTQSAASERFNQNIPPSKIPLKEIHTFKTWSELVCAIPAEYSRMVKSGLKLIEQINEKQRQDKRVAECVEHMKNNFHLLLSKVREVKDEIVAEQKSEEKLP